MSTAGERVEIDPGTRAAQAKATDPGASAWVTANAGSGKTYVLSRRVIRLLLQGTAPSRLLCLTFTKAAAAEMKNRVFSTLANWTMLEDEALAREIRDTTLEKPDEAVLKRARQLFALALDTPGGLKIQTIHAFCESLLHQFPLEANVPGMFELADDIQQAMLIEEARRRVTLVSMGLAEPAQGGSPEAPEYRIRDLANAFETLREHASDAAIEKAFGEMIRRRQQIGEFLEDGVASAMAPLWEALRLSPQANVQELIAGFEENRYFDSYARDVLLPALEAQDGKTAASLLEDIGALLSTTDPERRFELRKTTFLTASGGKRKHLISEKFMNATPMLRETFDREQSRLLGEIDRLKSLEVLKASEALFTLGEAILAMYRMLKQNRGLLDYDDLIARSVHLLNRREIADWVRFKLDQGIDHLLIDEAQDTSPSQWRIIEALTEEFFAGEGSRTHARTVFVVGDEKQSIYSFQGADLATFRNQAAALSRRVKNGSQTINKPYLILSFRSTEEVLTAVDQVFAIPENRRGLGLGEEEIVHSAQRLKAEGEVVIWESFEQPDRKEKENWLEPVDRQAQGAEEQLAQKIASTIADWIGRGDKLPGRDRPVRPGDILILVRKRDRFAAAITRELKRSGLPSAGADRLRLAEHIAVLDLMAVARLSQSRLDDLALASLLKSPLFGLGEEELFQLAHGRDKATLIERIAGFEATGEFGERLRKARQLIGEIVENGSRQPVFDFYAGLFARHDLRGKFLARLGHEVEEVLDGFLEAAMDYDRKSGMGLVGFAEWLSANNPELKREIDMEANEIRVITVHSSKGLEAPIVFLVDPGTGAFSSSHAPALVQLEENGQWLWQAGRQWRVEAARNSFERIEMEAEEEYRRLLYVGMTRAADRLILCGYRPRRQGSQEHWLAMVRDALSAANGSGPRNGRLVEEKDLVGRRMWRWVIDHPEKRESTDKHHADDTMAVDTLPSWIGRAPPEAEPVRPLNPSGVLRAFEIGTNSREGAASTGGVAAIHRGDAVHRLLQLLPGLAIEQRPVVGTRFFEEFGQAFDEEVRKGILSEVLAVLADPSFARIMGPASRAELPVAGELEIGGRTFLVRGQIDRLAILDGRMVITDFKTNRLIPEAPSAMPVEYLLQLAFYREMIREAFSPVHVDTAIGWTSGPVWMAVPGDLLDEAMTRLEEAVRPAS